MKHNTTRHLVLLLLLCSMGVSKSWAQQQKVLKLQEAIELGLKNSNQLKYNTAKIEEATAALREAVDRKLPEATVSGSYLRLNHPYINLQPKSDPNPGSGGASGNPTPNPSQAAYGLANVSLPLYSGLRIKYGIESAKYLAEATRLDAEHDKEGIILNTIDAFNNLYKSRAAVALVNESLQTAQQRVKDFSNLEKNGLLARNDLLKAQLQASNTELSLLDAQNNWKLANISMNLLLGLPDSTELVPDSTNIATAASLKSYEEYVQAGLQSRNDLAALDLRKKAAATGVKATAGEKLPSLALTGGYAALTVPNLATVANAVNVGVGVQYSLSALWKNGAKVQQAKAREKELEVNKEQLSDAIRLQIAQAYQNYELSRKKIDVLGTAVAQATENYRIVKNKYENSLATATDLLDADVAQLQAKLNHAFAQSDALVAYNKLLQAAGLLNETSSK
jgi:outer membrane protein